MFLISRKIVCFLFRDKIAPRCWNFSMFFVLGGKANSGGKASTAWYRNWVFSERKLILQKMGFSSNDCTRSIIDWDYNDLWLAVRRIYNRPRSRRQVVRALCRKIETLASRGTADLSGWRYVRLSWTFVPSAWSLIPSGWLFVRHESSRIRVVDPTLIVAEIVKRPR